VNDVKTLLELELGDGVAPEPGRLANPAADLARGRKRLRRRRLGALGGVTAAVLCGALVPLSLHGSGGAAATRPSVAAPGRGTVSSGPGARSTGPGATGQGQVAPSRKIALVAWEGTQPPGYRVTEMPKGWVVQGSNPYALVIAPGNDPSKDPDVFVGKLVVMLQSRDATSPPAGTPQPVNGRSGFFQVQGDTQVLTFQIAGGRWVVIQAPTSLGWDGAELARFADGVQVLVAAQPGRG
jgi:hypothetical protein